MSMPAEHERRQWYRRQLRIRILANSATLRGIRHGLFYIGDEVFGFFQADVEADQVAAVVAVGAAERLVSHYEAADAAPAVADFEEAQRFDEFYDSVYAPRVVEDN